MNCHQAISAMAASRPASTTTVSDEALIARIAKDDRDAMRLLFTRHRSRVYRFLLRLVGNESTAEDLLNEVFVDVWRGASRFESRSQATTWILGIARFKALSALRRRACEGLDDDVAESIVDTADDPEAVMQKADRSAILQDCLRHLSSAHRQVLDLVYYHEQSIEQVAKLIGVPENTVKTRAFHARKRIAELMAARGLEPATI